MGRKEFKVRKIDRNERISDRVDFSSRGMLNGTCLSEALEKLQNTLEDTEGSDNDMEGNVEAVCV